MSRAVQKITPELRRLHVPEPLQDKALWCVWTYERKEGVDKPLKVPFYVGRGKRYGEQGSAEDRGRLTTLALARDDAIKRGMTGVGFAPLDGEGIIALDFDNCVRGERVDPIVLELVAGTYAEFSPSGNGVRAFYRGSHEILGNRKSKTTGETFGFEVFSSRGFVTVTGNMLPHVELIGLQDTIADLPQKVIAFAEQRFGQNDRPKVDPDDFMAGHEPKLGMTIGEMEDLLDKLDPDMGREEWIKVGMALHHETEGDDTGFALWDEWSSAGGKYPGREGLQAQWESFHRRRASGRHQVTMATVKWLAKDASNGPTVAKIADVERLADRRDQSDLKFPLVSAGDLSRQKPTEWLIKGILPEADIVMLYGASGSGKSFATIDMASHIALGRDWRDKRTKRGKVVIIAAEGGGGYGKRLKAWCLYHEVDIDTLPIEVITVPPNFLDRDDIAELVASLKQIEDLSLVIVDTFAQVTPGANENASEDMGTALANARVLRKATGATIWLIHHSGKDASRGARGWSGARAAMDAELEVTHEEGQPVRMIKLTKQKDGEDGLRYGFKLQQIVTGQDGDGDDITSCVAVDADPPKTSVEQQDVRATRYGALERHLMEVAEMVDANVETMPKERFIDMAVSMLPEPPPGQRDTRRTRVVRALSSISKKADAPLAIGGEGGRLVVFYE